MTEQGSVKRPTKAPPKTENPPRFIDRLFAAVYRYVPAPCFVLFLVALVAAILHVASCFSPGAADMFNASVGSAVRFVLAKATDFFSFSLGEMLLLSLPVLLALFIIGGVRRRQDKRRFVRYLAVLLSLLFILYTLFVLTIGCAYHGSSLDQKMGITRRDVAFSELYSTAEYMLQKANESAQDVAQRKVGGATLMGYTTYEMSEKLVSAFDTLRRDYDFLENFRSHPKAVALSRVMSYSHITGVYSYMTGEANLNVDFPDYTLPFTAAHEMAHQRGIAREDEANFIAYLVCISSDDPYIRYSGYLNMFEYLGNALYSASPKAYYELMEQCSPKVRDEMVAYSQFYDQYRDSVLGEISGAVNDAYLQIQGTPGTRSYGMVVDLAVAYYRYEI